MQQSTTHVACSGGAGLCLVVVGAAGKAAEMWDAQPTTYLLTAAVLGAAAGAPLPAGLAPAALATMDTSASTADSHVSMAVASAVCSRLCISLHAAQHCLLVTTFAAVSGTAACV